MRYTYPLLTLLLLSTIIFATSPTWEDGTYWISHRYSDQVVLSYVDGNLIHSYIWDSVCRQDPTHLTYEYSDFTISKIIFPEKDQQLVTNIKLLDFPLEQDKVWETYWTVQKEPNGPIYSYPVKIQVLGTERFDYDEPREAYLLEITLNDSITLKFHYVPQEGTFPGQPPMEVYEEIESGQPFHLLEYGNSDNPGPHLAEDQRETLCNFEGPLPGYYEPDPWYVSLYKKIIKLFKNLTTSLRLHLF